MSVDNARLLQHVLNIASWALDRLDAVDDVVEHLLRQHAELVDDENVGLLHGGMSFV